MYKIYFLLLIMATASVQATDPTKPFGSSLKLTNKVASKNALTLQTIIESGDKISVVINGQSLRLGEKIRGYKLSEITRESVLLSSSEKNLKLSLFSSVVAK